MSKPGIQQHDQVIKANITSGRTGRHLVHLMCCSGKNAASFWCHATQNALTGPSQDEVSEIPVSYIIKGLYSLKPSRTQLGKGWADL